MIRGLFLPLCLAFALAAPAARADSYAIDPVHTRVAFQVSHAGFSFPVGSFSGASGRLEFERGDWRAARVEVRIPVGTLELGDADWQGKMLDRTFFDAQKFPEAVFVSTSVEPTGTDTATVTGNLSLHGVTGPVTLQVRLNALGRHPLTFRRTVGFSATAMLSRKAFGMDRWQNLVGDDVRLILEVEATRERRDGEDADAQKERDAG